MGTYLARLGGLVILALGMMLGGCISGPDWVARDGSPIDPRLTIRCNEYETSQNGGRFTAFNASDKADCMRAHGAVRPWEVKK